MTKIVVDIPPDIYKKIDIKRVREDKPNKNQVINDILQRYFET